MWEKVVYSADDFISHLTEACSDGLDIRKRYEKLRHVFCCLMEQETDGADDVFPGFFSKMEYVVGKYDLTPDVAEQLNSTRRVLFPQGGGSSAHDSAIDYETSFPYDLKSIWELVSRVYGVTDVPEALRRYFPKGERNCGSGEYDVSLIRVMVLSWNHDYINAVDEQLGKKVRICYGPGNRHILASGKSDWSYLNEIVSVNSQLNLVRVHIVDGVLMPELIIFEPDYLVNITTIASCFDDALIESPYVSLLGKLKIDVPTIPIHIGNLAGQFLDETVHERETSFADSVNEYFHTHALSMVACPDMSYQDKVREFYDNARSQKENINKLIHQDLPKVAGEMPRESIVLEPSFFSEVLGIQGRLDFLYERDGKAVILEQKSGKGAFVPGHTDADTPSAQVKHLVQLILYRALYVYEFGNDNKGVQQIYLLYSKYKNGLVRMANSPELLQRALRIRNLLTWCDMIYAKDGIQILANVKASDFRGPSVNDKFWNNWKVPELNSVLEPIQKATPLERAYFFRFLRFIATEQLLSKVGSRMGGNNGFASIWLNTLEDKLAAGDILLGMTMSDVEVSKVGVDSVALHIDDTYSSDSSNFRVGDIVILYPYHEGDIPNACAQMVHRASIVSLSPKTVRVALRNSQTDVHVFNCGDDVLWAVEHDLFESSTSVLYQSMQRFLISNQQRKDMILGTRPLAYDSSATLNGEYGEFDDLVSHSKRAKDMFMVIGPPGTGKTSFGLLNILREELLEEGSNVLLLSYTNRAVDEICGKLKTDCIDFVRIGNSMSASDEFKSCFLSERLAECKKASEVRGVIESVRVFCGTTASVNSNIHLLGIKKFSLAIIDEASQILEPHLIGLLSARYGDENSIGRIVLIGDHKQLPAVVLQNMSQSAVTEPELININLTDCRLSFFERQIKRLTLEDGTYDNRFVYMLTRQGRMHEQIASFPNMAFYDNRLEIIGSPVIPHQDIVLPESYESDNSIDVLLKTRNMAFICTPPCEETLTGKVNPNEAKMIASMVRRVFEMEKGAFDVNKTVGVIVPYRNQISLVRNAIDMFGIEELNGITIDTVERFQGSQRDYILYGFTVNHRYQMNFLINNTFEERGKVIDRKLNVAMTRARRHLFMFGNVSLLSENSVFKELIDFSESHHCLIDVPIDDFCEGRFLIP